MTVYNKPTQTPRWGETTGKVKDANLVEPSSAQKNTGWTIGQAPASSTENWRANLTFNWLAWLNQFLFSQKVDASDHNESLRLLALTAGDVSLGAGSVTGTNLNAGNVSLRTGAATGTGSAYIDFLVSTAGSSGSASNTQVRYLTMDGATGLVTANREIRAEQGLSWGANYSQAVVSSNLRTTYDSGDYLEYVRSTNTFDFRIASTSKMTIGASANQSVQALQVMDANYQLSIVSSNPRVLFDSNDYIEYNRASNYLSVVSGSTEVARVSSKGLIPTVNDTVAIAGQPAAINRHTVPIVCCVVDSAGTLSAGSHWNVASASRSGTGTYLVTMDVAQSTALSALIATCIYTGDVAFAMARAVGAPGNIEVTVYDATGALVDNGFSLVGYGY